MEQSLINCVKRFRLHIVYAWA
ncbi:hypothetical protein PUN4_590001 [Paraburkholderia unamae]|nr:hypothetical protein PUN4_590001 [Paraburkholderia unamae]